MSKQQERKKKKRQQSFIEQMMYDVIRKSLKATID